MFLGVVMKIRKKFRQEYTGIRLSYYRIGRSLGVDGTAFPPCCRKEQIAWARPDISGQEFFVIVFVFQLDTADKQEGGGMSVASRGQRLSFVKERLGHTLSRKKNSRRRHATVSGAVAR